MVLHRRSSTTLTGLLLVGASLLLPLAAGCGRHDRAGSPTDSEETATTVVPPTTTAGTGPSDTGAPTTLPGPTTLPPSPSEPPSTPPPATGPAIQVRRGNPDRMTVALTFDAGSDAGSTTAILDTLAANGIRATFGMTGRWAEQYPDLVRRMVADGHQLLNHSYDHPSFTGRSTGTAPLSRDQRVAQLDRTERVLAGLGVTATPWFRPPYGDTDASVDADVGSAGYRYDVLWTVDSLGWKGIPVDEIVGRCLDGAVPGAILLMHVGSASADGAALPAIIDGLRARGYGFDTVASVVSP